MNTEMITLNEVQNDGTLIHLYWNNDAEVWLSYGYSAYALRLLLKVRGYDCLRRYSEQMQMPCTLVGEGTIRLLASQVGKEVPQKAYFRLVVSQEIDESDYQEWVHELREELRHQEVVEEPIPISKEVPKDRFIADHMSSFARNTKRLIDFFTAAVCLVLFSPLMLLCYVAIRREDGGPAVFKQERIGRFGKPFYIYKFRSMRMDAERLGPQLSRSGGEGDPRLTRVGAFIRRHHLDELPQLWNVFIGDMAFVGPRPERRFFIDQILEHDKRYSYLYQIRPGVTSYATLYNGYTDTMEKMLRRLEYDLFYLSHRSLWFDMKILFMTFCRIAFGKVF